MAAPAVQQPQLRLYKDESLSEAHVARLGELWTLFKDDNPRWLTRQDVLNTITARNVEQFIFVFSSFEGTSFEHLRALNARIISAHCMLHSLRAGRKLPRTLVPIYSLAMVDMNICCTNMEKRQREEIYQRAEMMRAKTTKIFHEQVTHLITTEVGSAKYHAAGGMKIPVMLPEWIMDIWRTCETEDVHGSDARFLRHKCPIFYKYVICASGINEAKKNELRRLVESEGGTYRGDLLCGTTTHLVCNEAKGVKYDHARLWKITVIKPQWIHDCIGAGYCLPEKNYLIESENQQTSTPTAAAAAAKQAASSTGGGGGGATGGGAGGGANGAKRANALDNIDVSVIAGVSSARGAANLTATAGMLNRSSAMASRLVNETESGSGNNNMRANHNNSTFSSPSLPPPQSALPHSAHKNNAAGGGGGLLLSSKQQSMQMPMSSYADLEKELNQIGKIKLTLFDGIGIYSENVNGFVSEKLKRICNSGGAIRFDEYNSDVTHVIVNQLNDKQCKSYIELNPEVNIVTIDWLINSCKENQLLDCKPFCVYKNALNSVKTPKKRPRADHTVTPNLSISAKSFDSDLNDCLSQYLSVEKALMRAPPPAHASPAVSNQPQASKVAPQQQQQQQQPQQSRQTVPKPSIAAASSVRRNGGGGDDTTLSVPFEGGGDTTTPASRTMLEADESALASTFQRRKFQIIGFDESEIESIGQALVEEGAALVAFDPDMTDSWYRHAEVNYTVLPMTIPQRIPYNNPVTVHWMRKCIEQKQLVPVNSDVLFQPIPRYHNDTPLVDCVITVSGFAGDDREIIANLCRLLGAHVQASLTISRKNKDIMPNTHLICKTANGPKFVAARSWNLPVVGVEWLVETCVLGQRAPEAEFFIENDPPFDTRQFIDNLDRVRRNDDSYLGSNGLATNPNQTGGATNSSLLSRSRHNESRRRSDSNSSRSGAAVRGGGGGGKDRPSLSDRSTAMMMMSMNGGQTDADHDGKNGHCHQRPGVGDDDDDDDDHDNDNTHHHTTTTTTTNFAEADEKDDSLSAANMSSKKPRLDLSASNDLTTSVTANGHREVGRGGGGGGGPMPSKWMLMYA